MFIEVHQNPPDQGKTKVLFLGKELGGHEVAVPENGVVINWKANNTYLEIKTSSQEKKFSGLTNKIEVVII